ncbi:MAG: hypothetical protein IPO22_03995 [Anaerolineales bacterium]|nr:hypothetical protein [Anaerolineales bacterium]
MSRIQLEVSRLTAPHRWNILRAKTAQEVASTCGWSHPQGIIIGAHPFRRCGRSCLTPRSFSHLCQKMGVQANYWRETNLQIHVYRVEEFHEMN